MQRHGRLSIAGAALQVAVALCYTENTPVVGNNQVVAELCEEGKRMEVGRGVGRVGAPVQEQHTGRLFLGPAKDEGRVKGNAVGAGELSTCNTGLH